MLENVKGLVSELMIDDKTGHDSKHIFRVYDLAMKFAELEKADKEVVGLGALLHDVDDYKLVGLEKSKELFNAREIMNKSNIESCIQSEVIGILETVGYKKSLSGIRPITLEGKIVSDADMCDAIGANGILRIYTYHLYHSSPFFDKREFPIENITAEEYNRVVTDSGINHFFEKVLKLKGMMLTKSGDIEAAKRHDFTVEFLRRFFEEEEAIQWLSYLDSYLEDDNIRKR